MSAQTCARHGRPPEQIASDGLDGLQAQSLDTGGRVVSAQRGQVDKRDGLQQPSSLRGERRQGVGTGAAEGRLRPPPLDAHFLFLERQGSKKVPFCTGYA